MVLIFLELKLFLLLLFAAGGPAAARRREAQVGRAGAQPRAHAAGAFPGRNQDGTRENTKTCLNVDAECLLWPVPLGQYCC